MSVLEAVLRASLPSVKAPDLFWSGAFFISAWVTHFVMPDKEAAARLFFLTSSFPFRFMKYLLFPALIGLGLAGCSSATSDEAAVATQPPAAAHYQTTATQPLNVPASPAASGSASGLTSPTAPSAQTVIYQGEMDLAVDSFAQATNRINQLLRVHRSYLSTAHETRTNGQHRQEMTVQVPPEEFSPLVAALSQLGRIDNKDVASSDVTADVLQARTNLGNKQIAEARCQQLLARAASPAEAHRLEEQLRQLRADVAADQARVQQFGARSTWATLTLRYFQEKPDAEPSAPKLAFVPRFAAAFAEGWEVILQIGVGLATVWPLLLAGAVAAWLVRRWHLRQSA